MKTTTEANRNFTALMKEVDEKKIVYIQKNKKPRYVMMTKEMYENIAEKEYLQGKFGEDTVRIEYSGDRVYIYQIKEIVPGLLAYRICSMPKEMIYLERHGNNVTVKADLQRKPKSSTGRASFIYEEALADVEEEAAAVDSNIREEVEKLERLKKVVSILDEMTDLPEGKIMNISLKVTDGERELMGKMR